ncbi:hypothetical protein MPTK1_6g17040 [Marchantia polymorpha subsp. ruderalis]|uniref:Uncharacterized protein n=2 Tax=Marchantia polymorpha TaxID=3197 RepID=A0AAF6BSW7_MARPO|nr:hypothetical protein MARPO_0144s0011 [Marchantia polymorpha]BBN15101.1 hypothetical protein Mp_6g17040 [Marchantia polymorpha subsp. ruderalis]|eukprot:PTQ29292.1 hypothetical protein MARPO_0144s0011 [Marchantia polymorpha]
MSYDNILHLDAGVRIDNLGAAVIIVETSKGTSAALQQRPVCRNVVRCLELKKSPAGGLLLISWQKRACFG